jgi:hypothetical protein
MTVNGPQRGLTFVVLPKPASPYKKKKKAGTSVKSSRDFFVEWSSVSSLQITDQLVFSVKGKNWFFSSISKNSYVRT